MELFSRRRRPLERDALSWEQIVKYTGKLTDSRVVERVAAVTQVGNGSDFIGRICIPHFKTIRRSCLKKILLQLIL